MQMVESGMIDLNTPIDRYLDDLPESWRKIRVRQLLAHTSGLPNIVDRQGLIGGGTELDAWREFKKRPLIGLAGESFTYNQTNYGLLAKTIVSQTIGGGRSAFVVYPDRGLTIVILTNLVGANPENFIPQIARIYESSP